MQKQSREMKGFSHLIKRRNALFVGELVSESKWSRASSNENDVVERARN